MLDLEDLTLRSQRLTYRLLEDSHMGSLRVLLADPRVTEPGGFRPAKDPEEFLQFFQGLTCHRTALGIFLQGQLIGYVHLYPYQSEHPSFAGKTCVRLGYVIGRAFQNRGYGTEMLATITGYLKTKFDCCFADHFLDNIPSQRVIEKCGYRYFEDYTLYFEELGKEMTCRSYVYTEAPWSTLNQP